MRQFIWDERRNFAAQLVAEGRLSDPIIAAQCGTSRATLNRWRLATEFQTRVAEIVAEQRAALREAGIAEKRNRMDAYNARWDALQQVIAQRALDPLMATVPGGKTGLIVASPVLVKVYETGGEDDDALTSLKVSRLVHQFAIDTGTLRELRELEKQAATEMGDWVEKAETKQSGTIKLLGGVDIDRL